MTSPPGEETKTPPPKISKEKKSIQLKDWVQEVTDREQDNIHVLRNVITCVLLATYVGLTAFICCVIMLQGFKPFGFALDSTSIKWLGTTVAAQLVSLLMVMVRELFKRFQASRGNASK